MTRKSIAVISATTLAAFGLASPSFAAQADLTKVSLEPTDGTSYVVVDYDGATFSLDSNEAVNIQGGDLSWTVEGGGLLVLPFSDGVAAATTGDDEDEWTLANADDTWERTDGVVTVVTADWTDDDVAAGDVIYVAAADLVDENAARVAAGTEADVAAGYYVITAISNADDTFSFEDGDATDVLAADGEVANAETLAFWSFVDYDATDDILTIDSGSGLAANTETLVLYSVDADQDGAEVEVTAWVDDNNNGEIGGTEYASPTRTVSFITADDISVSAIDWTVNLGGTNAAAEVTFSPAINWDQSEELDALITNADGQFTGDAAFAAAATGVITFDDDTDNAAAITAGYVTIKTYTQTANELIATNRIKVVDNDVDDVVVSVATGANVAQSADDANVTLRSEDGTRVTVTVTVVDADDDPISGVVVTVNEAGDGNSTLDADADIEVGGEAVDADDASFDEVTLTTNADGEATLVITSADATAADALDLTFLSEGTDQDITFTWADATLVANITSSVLADDAAAVTDFWLGTGNSTSTTFVVYDQFGSVADNGDFRVKTEINQNDADGDALDAVFKYSKVSNGVASVTISDEAESEADVTAEFTLQEWDADADNWGAAAIADDNITGVTNTYTTADDEATVVDVDAFADQADGDVDDNLAIPFTTALEASNAFLGGANDQGLVAGAESVSITGAVSLESTGAAYAGGTITISGSSDLLFTNNVADADAANYVMAFGSLTATLDGNGDFSFLVYGNVTGEYELTITSGGTSETVDVEIDVPQDAANAGIDDVTIDIAGPAYVMPGSTYIATITPKDAFGNAIPTADNALEVTWDGPGLISGNLPTETGADGTVRVYILFGQNETGSGELSVTYWGLDGDIDATTDNVTETATVTLGAAPAPAADTKVNAGSFKGYVAIYAKGHEGKRLSAKVGNDWVVVPVLASNFERVVEFTGAGYTIAVRIYIDRVLVDTITVTTK